jgi:dTDP-4-amino-4,6-dideoxygalactose transaminase
MVPGQHGARLGREMLLGEMQPFATGGGMWTYRMAPIAAAIATAQLRKLPHMNASRQANFDRLREAIADLPFITWPTLDEGSQRGWYGTPGFFGEEQAGISRAAFVQACQAEGVQIGGEGYTDWSQIASLQNPELLGQLVVTEHVNGTRYTPVPAGSFPNHEAIRRTMLLFGIPAAESPVLIDQVAAAVHKVAANVDLLKETVAVS